MISLDINGVRRRRGALKVSKSASPGVAVLADIEYGLPFKDDTVEEVYLDHTLENVQDLMKAMKEVWRVCRAGALIHVWASHATSSWASTRNPRQKRLYTIETFEFFDAEKNLLAPADATFEIEHSRLYLTSLRQGQRPRLTGGIVSTVVESLANRDRGSQYRWERWLGSLVGFEEFFVLLTTVKIPPWAEE
jgi:ubiquinone/menaquinone biosynthesis C-methylase UbiE